MLNKIPLVTIEEFRTLESKVRTIRSEQVYDSKESAMEDLTRLIKLGDVEGIKLRVMEIYREKEEQDVLINDQMRLLSNIGTTTHNSQNASPRNPYSSQSRIDRGTAEIADKIFDLEKKLNLMSHDKELLKERHDRELAELHSQNRLLADENDRLRSHYEVLKEHELSIIRDYEAKLHREQLINQNKVQELEQDLDKEKEGFNTMHQGLVKTQDEYHRIRREL